MSAILARLARQTRPSRLSSITAIHQASPQASLSYHARFNSSTTKGDQPNASQNLDTQNSPKTSDSATEADVKSSRATDGRPPEHGGSVSHPISKATEGVKGADEEGGDPTKKDPSKPAGQKKEEVLKQGEEKLKNAENPSTSEQIADAKQGSI